MENKTSKSKASASASTPIVSGGNNIVEKKLNNQVVELVTQPVKKGGAKKVEPKQQAQSEPVQPAQSEPVQPEPVQAQPEPVQAQQEGNETKAPAKKVGRGAKKVATTATATPSATPSATVTATATPTTPAKKVSAKKTVITTELEAEPDAQGKLRYFKLFYNNEICGRYCGKKPKQAANKAFSSIVKDMKKDCVSVSVTIDSQLEVLFTIKECTRNSKHKEYKYIGKRHLLKEPVKVSIDNGDGSVKEIVYKFHNQLQKAPKE